jgi:peptide/nickel transport system substrate-binding protein
MKTLHLTCGLLATALILSACGMSGGSSADGPSSQNIVVDEPFGPASGWALETDDAFVLSKTGCLETLVQYPPDGVLKPMLAESWKQTAPTEWDVTLRQGVRFQNGTPMDAQAVAGALDHVLKSKTPARAFSPKVVATVTATDPSTVRVTTVKPDVLLPYRLASPNTGILAPQAYSGAKITPIGTCTGPFAITQEIPQQAVKLKRNDSYWGSHAKLASAEVRFIPDGATRATQVRSGEAQIAKNVPVANLQSLKGDPSIKIATQQLPRTTSLMLNNRKAPFDNEIVRQAIQAAIDPKTINDAVYQGGAQPAVGPFAPSEPWTPKNASPVAADPQKARALLAQAGVNPASIKVNLLAYTEKPEFSNLSAVIQEQLKAVGVAVSIQTGDYASMEPKLLAGDFDMALLSRNHLGDVADPLGFLTSDYTCGGSYNLSHFCDPGLDTVIQQATSTQDATARYALYGQAATALQSRAVDIFLVHETQTDAAARAQNYVISPYYTLTADLSLG